jgi:hypothetical protein
VKQQFAGVEEIEFEFTGEDERNLEWYSTFYISAEWTKGHKNENDYYFRSEFFSPMHFYSDNIGVGVSTDFADKHRGKTETTITVKFSVGGKEKL